MAGQREDIRKENAIGHRQGQLHQINNKNL